MFNKDLILTAPAKLLVANRSEIAIRVFRAATELGLRTVALYAPEDRFAVHRFKADEAYEIGQGKGPVGAYLDIDGIIALAKSKGVQFIHPGYGFLAENTEFARKITEAGLTWIGPRPEVIELMGDKVRARALAQQAGVRVLPGTEEAVEDRAEAMRAAHEIGFPLIIKAAAGGGGRGMRVVQRPEELEDLLDEAQNEAERSFGDSSVFLERYVPHAKHIEVQILGDRHGNVVHLHERDCSVQRRHQKVIEVAPSVGLDEEVRKELCAAAVELARAVRYDNAGTVEFLLDVESNEWFFIEMNPRIQVEHTVTEQITGVDLVRSQILIAQGHELHSEEIAIPAQESIPRIGFSVQARITTEDPERGFAPDYGKILAYRSAAGLGVRLDGAQAAAGAVITPFYDSLLVKLTVSGPTFEIALARMDRALREFRIRGVKTNIPFVENVIAHPLFRSGEATTTFIDETPELFEFTPRRDRATRLLQFLADTIVNGNPNAKGYKPAAPLAPARVPETDKSTLPPPGLRQKLQELGADKFADWIQEQPQLFFTDTTMRDAQQSLLATRMRTYDMARIADAVARRAPQLFSLEVWGGATFDTALRFGREDPWERLALLREKIPNIPFQMLFRGSNAVGYSNYPDNVVAGFVGQAAESGIDIFRVFDSLNDLRNLRVSMEAIRKTDGICEAAICYTGDLLDPKRPKYALDYYLKLARELKTMGAHILAIKDMAGLCRPFAARELVRALKEEIGLPVHLHMHDTSGTGAASILFASEAGVDIADAALASMSGGTSQPNLNSLVAALQNTPRDSGLDLQALNEFSDYWEQVLPIYKPFDTAPRWGTAEVYLHEMPGGQFTNLKEQAAAMGLAARWPEIARTYAEVNQLFGDIVKVTPSSKVVGDMTMFLVSRGISAREVLTMPPGEVAFPESVIDMLSGGLGQPPGGFPEEVVRVVLGDKEPSTKRPGEGLPPLDLEAKRAELSNAIGREAGTHDLYSSLMYPQVFEEYAAFKKAYSDVSVLPSSAYFYGLFPGEEISIDIEAGKRLIVRLINVGEPDAQGQRAVNFELNGVARQALVKDRKIQPQKEVRRKADPAKPNEIAAPLPGLVANIAVDAGSKVSKGDKLFTLEAMKMYTTISAPEDGVIEELFVTVGDTVESKDLVLSFKE